MTAKAIQIVPNGHAPPSLTEAWAAHLIQAAVARIIHDPGQPRRTLDPATIRPLADNIQQYGLLHPLHLRPCGDDQLMLISGARRLEAVKHLGWTHVPAVVHAEPLTPRQLRLLQVSENNLREGVNAIEQALAFQDCLDGGTASQLAQELGIAVSTITRSFKLLEHLPAPVQELVRQGLPGTVARELAKKDISDDTKLELARRYVAGEFTNRSDVIAAVRQAKNGHAAAAPASLACEAAGVKVRIDLAAGQGLKEAEAALRELLADLKLHRAKTVTAFRDFLAAKAMTRKTASLHQAAEAALGELTPHPAPAKENSDV
jgi:ParB/RepB/Spo0J family partition protein